MYLCINATTGEAIVGSQHGVWLTRTVRRKTAREKWERSNLEMIVAVPWRKNEDNANMDGERFEGSVVVMDRDYQAKLEMEGHVPVPQSVYTTREDLEVFGFTTRCPGCMSLLEGTRETAEGGLKRS